MNKNQSDAEMAIRAAAVNWQGELLTRPDVKIFTGGAIGVGHLANLDSEKRGIPGAFHLGRKVVYPKQKVVEWLIGRLEI